MSGAAPVPQAAAAASPLKGIALLVAAMFSLTLLDATAKYLSQFYPVLLVTWARYFFNVLILLVWLGPSLGRRLIATRRPRLQLARGVVLAVSSILFFFSLSLLPLAEATAITYVTPVLITLVSVHVFRERPPHGTWLALAVSFAGVLLIVRPGSGVFSWPALLPLLTAFGFAAYQLMTSRLAGVDDRMATLFIGALVGTAVLSVAAPFVWTWQIDPMHAALLVALGGIAAFAHWLIISAYEHAQASTLAPFVYSQVIATLSLGWLVFGDFPDRWSIAGMALITGTGVALALRNRPRPVLSAPRR